MEQILESLSVLVIPPWRDETAMMVWAAFLAVAGTVIYLTLRRITMGRTLRALIDGGCADPASAKEANELIGASKRALEGRDRLIEKVAEEGAPTRYYLPNSSLKKAQYFMKASGTKWYLLLLEVLGAYILMVLAYYFLPSLLKIMESLNPFGA